MIDVDLLACARPERSDAWARAARRARVYSTWLIVPATTAALFGVQLALGREERRVDSALARARVAASQRGRTASRIRSLEDQEARLRSAEDALSALRSRERLGTTPALRVLGHAVPEDVWLERLHVRRAEITIQGHGRQLSSLVELANGLSALAVFDGPIELVDVRHTSPTFTFTLRGTLRALSASTRSPGR